jgi:hypothetical protein
MMTAAAAPTTGDPLRGPPVGSDDCAGAPLIALPAGSQVVVAGDSTLASDDPGRPACGMDPPRDSGAAGVWYRLIGTGNRVRVDACAGAAVDLVLRVYCGSCDQPVCAAADDDGCDPPGPTLAPRLAWCTQAGVEYLVLVSRYGAGPGGPFVLTVADGEPCPAGAAPSCLPLPPANDPCAGAAPIAPGQPVLGTTIDATADAGAPACGGVALRRAVWYTFTGNGHNVRLTACGPATGANVALAVYSGSCGSLACVAGNAAAACPDRADAPETGVFCAAPGVAYFVAVTDEADGSGLFEVRLDDLGPGPCTPRGACCAAGACQVTTRADCAGFYRGDGTVCTLAQWPGLDIPDNDPAGVASTIVVAGAPGLITDLNVSLIIRHTWQGDLRVTLQRNDGPEVSLIDRPGHPQTTFGFSADNFGNPVTSTPMVLDDQAIPARVYDTPFVAIPGTNNPTGSWLPDPGPLSAFNGLPLEGTWTLRVRDLAAQDVGRLIAWSLVPSPVPGPFCPAGPDCFSRLVNGVPPTSGGNYTRGGPNGVDDRTECIGDWDRNGALTPADVAQFVATWFASVGQSGNLDADIDCSGAVTPADVAAFVSRWIAAVQSPVSEGC